MNAGDVNHPAWDYLINGEEDPDWIKMNAHKKKQANNNLNRADYLLAFAQYYPYGPDYYIFGGMYKVKMIEPEVFNTTGYELTLMDDFADFRKRLIIKLPRITKDCAFCMIMSLFVDFCAIEESENDPSIVVYGCRFQSSLPYSLIKFGNCDYDFTHKKRGCFHSHTCSAENRTSR